MRVGTFNVYGLASSESEVHKAWRFLGLDIMCLVETWLRPSDEVALGLPHYAVALEPNRNGRPQGGIVMLHSENLRTRVIAKYATPHYQVLAVHVKPNLTVIGVYIAPSIHNDVLRTCLSRIKTLCRGPTVIMGDWNGRHLDWNDKGNRQGKAIRNWVLQWNFALRAPIGNPTFETSYGKSTVDFFVSRLVHVHNVSTQHGSWDSISDHNIVVGDIDWLPSRSAKQGSRISKAMLKNPDLLDQAKTTYEEKFPALLIELETLSAASEIDSAYQALVALLREPFETNRRPRSDRYRFFWDHQLDYLSKLRSKYYSKWKRRRDMSFWC